MIKKEEIEPFLNKNISVGVKHYVIPGKLFFYYGLLKYIDSNEIKIETNYGFKIIPLCEILDIHEKMKLGGIL